MSNGFGLPPIKIEGATTCAGDCYLTRWVGEREQLEAENKHLKKEIKRLRRIMLRTSAKLKENSDE